MPLPEKICQFLYLRLVPQFFYFISLAFTVLLEKMNFDFWNTLFICLSFMHKYVFPSPPANLELINNAKPLMLFLLFFFFLFKYKGGVDDLVK